jgi:hypothetical protein
MQARAHGTGDAEELRQLQDSKATQLDAAFQNDEALHQQLRDAEHVRWLARWPARFPAGCLPPPRMPTQTWLPALALQRAELGAQRAEAAAAALAQLREEHESALRSSAELGGQLEGLHEALAERTAELVVANGRVAQMDSLLRSMKEMRQVQSGRCSCLARP